VAQSKPEEHRITSSSPVPARADQWRGLVETAKAGSGRGRDRAAFEVPLSQLAITEEYHAYSRSASDGDVERASGMRKLDVKEIRGYNAVQGLKLVRLEDLAKFSDRRPPASFKPAAD